MSLFKTQDAKPELQSHATKQSLVTRVVTSKRQIGKSLLVLAEMANALDHNQSIQYCTGGRWSMHEMVRMILLKTGPAKVWMTTWTITEEPMRVLLDLIKTGYISELSAVLDYRIEKRKPEAFQLASNIITRIKLTKCHAKVAVIRNEEWNITIVGSANFSKNPRIEAGVIFTDKESADFHIQWIDDVIDGKEVFSAK
jgi:hypothetical protein